jgi:phospholipid/cholesterol/gamma-HCH transport system ATP-binding protein
VGLRGAQSLRPSELSGGMGRRVALARAIALDPDLIVYDEPFAGLDPITLNVVCHLIRTLNDALGATSIVVTYDVHEALRLADYLYLLNDGVIVGHGPTAAMVASDDPFVHQFLHAEPDGPVRFHFPAKAFAEELELVATSPR